MKSQNTVPEQKRLVFLPRHSITISITDMPRMKFVVYLSNLTYNGGTTMLPKPPPPKKIRGHCSKDAYIDTLYRTRNGLKDHARDYFIISITKAISNLIVTCLSTTTFWKKKYWMYIVLHLCAPCTNCFLCSNNAL